MTLTAEQRQLIRTALNAKAEHASVTPAQRAAIRELCATSGAHGEPEKFLIAFKIALVEAANAEQIPFGPERSGVLSRLVTAFIDELYAHHGNGERQPPRGREGPATAPRLILEDDSSGARL